MVCLDCTSLTVRCKIVQLFYKLYIQYVCKNNYKKKQDKVIALF